MLKIQTNQNIKKLFKIMELINYEKQSNED